MVAADPTAVAEVGVVHRMAAEVATEAVTVVDEDKRVEGQRKDTKHYVNTHLTALYEYTVKLG